jgi:hypothetical protein
MQAKILFSLFFIAGMLFAPASAAGAQAEMSYQLALPMVASAQQPVSASAAPAEQPVLLAQDPVEITAVQAARPIGSGMIDAWVMIDADRNAIYSAGDYGLSDALVCVSSQGRKFFSCVGTDHGDTWWEDLLHGRYLVTLNPATVPPGAQLRSIRCEETHTRVEYRGCRYDLANWKVDVRLGKTTRLNIFFALEP